MVASQVEHSVKSDLKILPVTGLLNKKIFLNSLVSDKEGTHAAVSAVLIPSLLSTCQSQTWIFSEEYQEESNKVQLKEF